MRSKRRRIKVTPEEKQYAQSLGLTTEQLDAARKREAVARAARVTISHVEGRDLRDNLDDRARRLGHALKPWKESVSCDGKWVASCRRCGALGIMYETTPLVGDAVTGNALTRECLKEGAV